jgi:RHS repeat-associated protein
VTICNPDGSEKLGEARVCSAFGNPFFFTGRRNDDETRWFDSSKPAGKEWQQGLMQFRNRMYDTGLGRFIGRDPLGYEDGINVYVYCHSRPSDFVDPMGLWGIVTFLNSCQNPVCPNGPTQTQITNLRNSACDQMKAALDGLKEIDRYGSQRAFEGAVGRSFQGTPEEDSYRDVTAYPGRLANILGRAIKEGCLPKIEIGCECANEPVAGTYGRVLGSWAYLWLSTGNPWGKGGFCTHNDQAGIILHELTHYGAASDNVLTLNNSNWDHVLFYAFDYIGNEAKAGPLTDPNNAHRLQQTVPWLATVGSQAAAGRAAAEKSMP